MADDPEVTRLRIEETQKVVAQHVFFNPPPDQDWKSCSELPTAEEVLMRQAEAEGLPANPVDTPWSSKDDYLAAQYKILRREGVEGLRYSVRSYIESCSNRQEMMDDEYTCVYIDVHVRKYLLSNLGPIARIEFSTARSPFQIKWRQSKRLTPGTIIAISTKADSFKTICKIATIAQRPYLDGLDQDPPLVDLMWANPQEGVFDPDLELVMIESRNGYFEATRHALVGLQHASSTVSPIDKYLTGVNTTDMEPGFVKRSPLMDLTSLAHKLPEHEGNAGERLDTLKDYDVLNDVPDVRGITTLDDSQLAALHRIISKELAIVQGPPGTGKTFTSVEALKVMVATRRRCGGQPIIVAAQTNHALDQLLNHCLDFEASICRVGGRTASPRIAEYTVFEIRQRVGSRQTQHYKTLNHQRNLIVKEIRDLVDDVFGDKLLSVPALLKAGIISQAQHDSLHDDTMTTDAQLAELGPFALWLGEDLIKAEIVRNTHPTQAQLDEAAEKLLAEWEYDEDLDNIANDEEDLDRIRGPVVNLCHVWSGKAPAHLRRWERQVKTQLAQCDDLFEIPADLRGAVYRHLQAQLLNWLTPRFTALLGKHYAICKKIKANKWSNDIQLINDSGIDIVGCTTTGLTKYRGLIAGLFPESLLIEEAAESREANITSAIYPSLQQLILVGDHQQLAPRCDIRWLGDPPYNLNVSLFQRMVNLNMPFVMLNQQRRMRPELRRILSPFYPDLTDHPYIHDSSGNRPCIPGMGGKNFWYFDHTWPEETNSEQSKFNEQEALMVVKFYAYLVANGTPADKITILTFYNGQRKFLLRKLRGEVSLVGTAFNVQTVDAYQGEENDVVLLSLVRSPVVGHVVGFLEDQRRAVVAISRARRGFYIFGNLENLLKAHSDSYVLWANIYNGFAEQGHVRRSQGLPLVCQNHGNEIWVKEVDDWGDNAGGCQLQCQDVRPCGHNCTLKCHFVPHERLPCSEPCRKTLSCGHGCNNFCSQACECSCPRFRDVQLRERVEAARVAKEVEEDEMPLEEKLIRRDNQPPAFLQVAVRSVRSLQSKNGGAGRTQGSAVSNEQGGTTPAKWAEYANNAKVHDEKLYQESGMTSAKGTRDAHSQIKIADTYQATALVNGRRAEEGRKSTRQVKVPFGTQQPAPKNSSVSTTRTRQPRRQGRIQSSHDPVPKSVNRPSIGPSVTVEDVDLLTGMEDDINMLTERPPLKPDDTEDLLIEF